MIADPETLAPSGQGRQLLDQPLLREKDMDVDEFALKRVARLGRIVTGEHPMAGGAGGEDGFDLAARKGLDIAFSPAVSISGPLPEERAGMPQQPWSLGRKTEYPRLWGSRTRISPTWG